METVCKETVRAEERSTASKTGCDQEHPTMAASRAQTVLAGVEADAPKSPEEEFEDAYLRSSKVIFNEHAQHEIFYKVLKIVSEESDEKKIAQRTRELPEMKVALRTPRYYLDALYDSGALTRQPLQSQDDDAAQTRSQDDDAAQSQPDDAVQEQVAADSSAQKPKKAIKGIEHYRWYISPVGSQLLADLSPVTRLCALLDRDERARPIFTSILRYCMTPRTRKDVEGHLEGLNILEDLDVFASFFLDELEQNGGLVWKGAWATTDEGKRVLNRGIEGNGMQDEKEEEEEL